MPGVRQAPCRLSLGLGGVPLNCLIPGSVASDSVVPVPLVWLCPRVWPLSYWIGGGGWRRAYSYALSSSSWLDEPDVRLWLLGADEKYMQIVCSSSETSRRRENGWALEEVGYSGIVVIRERDSCKNGFKIVSGKNFCLKKWLIMEQKAWMWKQMDLLYNGNKNIFKSWLLNTLIYV